MEPRLRTLVEGVGGLASGGAEDVEQGEEVVGRRDGVVGVGVAVEVDDGSSSRARWPI